MMNRRVILTLLATLIPPLTMAGCLGIQPKDLGQNGLNLNTINTNASSTFQFNFAITSSNSVYVQGQTSAQSAIIGTCNYAGTGCLCTFYDSNNNNLGSTTGSQITYDDVGNYLTCQVPSGVVVGSIASVVVSNISNTLSSPTIPISSVTPGLSNTLTLGQLVGTDLDENRVRYVYQYSCLYNYVEKQGTTSSGFDCSSQPTQCSGGSNFCLLQTIFPFYLYSDTYGSNMSTMPIDMLYNSTGTGSICGIQLKQYDCVTPNEPPYTTTSGPQKAFGLYDETSGIWQSSINLPPGPNQITTSYGYAAAPSSVTSLCPPALTPLVFYTAAVTGVTLPPGINPPSGSNMPATQTATQVSSPSNTPAAFQVGLVAGGNCNGTDCCAGGTSPCLPPSATVGTTETSTYSNAGQITFCAIPPALMP